MRYRSRTGSVTDIFNDHHHEQIFGSNRAENNAYLLMEIIELRPQAWCRCLGNANGSAPHPGTACPIGPKELTIRPKAPS
jgi:hypothetical protein